MSYLNFEHCLTEKQAGLARSIYTLLPSSCLDHKECLYPVHGPCNAAKQRKTGINKAPKPD